MSRVAGTSLYLMLCFISIMDDNLCIAKANNFGKNL